MKWVEALRVRFKSFVNATCYAAHYYAFGGLADQLRRFSMDDGSVSTTPAGDIGPFELGNIMRVNTNPSN